MQTVEAVEQKLHQRMVAAGVGIGVAGPRQYLGSHFQISQSHRSP